jgi:hypothetical protein
MIRDRTSNSMNHVSNPVRTMTIWLGLYLFLGSATTESMSQKRGFVSSLIYRGTPGFE